MNAQFWVGLAPMILGSLLVANAGRLVFRTCRPLHKMPTLVGVCSISFLSLSPIAVYVGGSFGGVSAVVTPWLWVLGAAFAWPMAAMVQYGMLRASSSVQERTALTIQTKDDAGDEAVRKLEESISFMDMHLNRLAVETPQRPRSRSEEGAHAPTAERPY